MQPEDYIWVDMPYHLDFEYTVNLIEFLNFLNTNMTLLAHHQEMFLGYFS